jgi:hypothetical protein
VLIEAYLEGSVLPPLPEHHWNKRKSKGPTLRQHEMDVLGFIKARLKPKTRRSAEKREPKPEAGAPPAPEENAAETVVTTGQLEPTGT